MANPSKRFPVAIEFCFNGKWYAIDAFTNKERADELLPLYQKRVGDNIPVRIRDTREQQAAI